MTPTTDREALDSYGPSWGESYLGRAECGVCRRKGLEGFMGKIEFDLGSFRGWRWWHVSDRRLSKRQASHLSPREARFGRSGQLAGTWSSLDLPLKLRCPRYEHMLRPIRSSHELFALVNKALLAGGPVVIPE